MNSTSKRKREREEGRKEKRGREGGREGRWCQEAGGIKG
jgi:hypothetical protein